MKELLIALLHAACYISLVAIDFYLIRQRRKDIKRRQSAYEKWRQSLSDEERKVANIMYLSYDEYLLKEYTNKSNHKAKKCD